MPPDVLRSQGASRSYVAGTCNVVGRRRGHDTGDSRVVGIEAAWRRGRVAAVAASRAGVGTGHRRRKGIGDVRDVWDVWDVLVEEDNRGTAHIAEIVADREQVQWGC